MSEQNRWHHGSFAAEGSGVTASYAVINRYGGNSTPPFDTLNVGLRVGDDEKRVVHNRAEIQQALGLNALVFARQVHGINTLHIDAESVESLQSGIDLGEEGCDILITALPEVGLAIQHADCQAVLLFAPRQAVIAGVHCGWQGNVQNVLGVAVQQLEEACQVERSFLKAFIGPGLGPCCAEFVNYKKEFPSYFTPHKVAENHFDFHAISKMQLEAAGVKTQHIETLPVCTSCSCDYFSYRRACRQAERKTGRNSTVIYLKEGL